MGKPKADRTRIILPDDVAGTDNEVVDTIADQREGDTASSAEIAGASQAEAVDWKDKFLRAKADFQNLQRRSIEERHLAIRYANANFARSILEVLDGFERTLEVSGKGESGDSLVAGVRIIYEKFLKALKDHNVEPIEALGQVFDPTVHEALSQLASSDHPPQTVMQEIQKGYQLYDRVIRPARVIISKEPDQDETRLEDSGADQGSEDSSGIASG